MKLPSNPEHTKTISHPPDKWEGNLKTACARRRENDLDVFCGDDVCAIPGFISSASSPQRPGSLLLRYTSDQSVHNHSIVFIKLPEYK